MSSTTRRGALLTKASITWEHTFGDVGGPPTRRATALPLQNGNLWVAEAVARDMANVPLEDALKLVYLYAEKESPKYERAAMRWLERYITESSPILRNFAKVTRELADKESCQDA